MCLYLTLHFPMIQYIVKINVMRGMAIASNLPKIQKVLQLK